MFAGYGSDSESEEKKPVVPTLTGSSLASSSTATPNGTGKPKKKVIDYNTLIKGVAKPLDVGKATKEEEEEYAPVMGSGSKRRIGLLGSLPRPKRAGFIIPPELSINNELTEKSHMESIPSQFLHKPAASEVIADPKKDEPDEAMILESDDSDDEIPGLPAAAGFFSVPTAPEPILTKPKAAPKKVIAVPQILEEEEIAAVASASSSAAPKPQTTAEIAAKMFPHLKGLTAKEQQELLIADRDNAFNNVHGDSLPDKDWFIKSAGKKQTVTGIMQDLFQSESGSKINAASGQQKRKHQINSLAAEYQEHGAELLEKSALGKFAQGQTARKYGW